MKDAMSKIREWNELAGVECFDSINMENYHKRKALRQTLILEECVEFVDAQREDDMIGIADSLADLIYVICGAALAYGIPLTEVFDEVQRSNMSKFKGGIKRRDDGKILKGDYFEEPDIKSILYPKDK